MSQEPTVKVADLYVAPDGIMFCVGPVAFLFQVSGGLAVALVDDQLPNEVTPERQLTLYAAQMVQAAIVAKKVGLARSSLRSAILQAQADCAAAGYDWESEGDPEKLMSVPGIAALAKMVAGILG